MYTENFRNCLLKVLRFEGGYVNDPDDPGAETVFGISRKYHPDWVGWQVIDSIPDKSQITLDFLKENPDLFDAVAKFYYYEFYIPVKADKIEEFAPKLACLLFDTAVNTGVHAASKILQKAINKKLVKLEKPELSVDGVIGPMTIGILIDLFEKNYNDIIIIDNFKFERILYYIEITQKNQNLCKYLKGWVNRTIEA